MMKSKVASVLKVFAWIIWVFGTLFALPIIFNAPTTAPYFDIAIELFIVRISTTFVAGGSAFVASEIVTLLHKIEYNTRQKEDL